MGAEELRVVLMAIGRVMTTEESQATIHQIKIAEDDPIRQKEAPDDLNLDEFIRLMSKEILENAIDEELVECFKLFGAHDD